MAGRINLPAEVGSLPFNACSDRRLSLTIDTSITFLASSLHNVGVASAASAMNGASAAPFRSSRRSGHTIS
jgi:hypothetical protein